MQKRVNIFYEVVLRELFRAIKALKKEGRIDSIDPAFQVYETRPHFFHVGALPPPPWYTSDVAKTVRAQGLDHVAIGDMIIERVTANRRGLPRLWSKIENEGGYLRFFPLDGKTLPRLR